VLADVVAALMHWLAQARDPAAPAAWAERGRALLAAFFDARHERERASLAAVHDALRAWLEPCAAAGFDEPVDLAVAREAWLGGIDEPGLGRRFRAGGVTFCTLLPMRAIPFEAVCLLGMNDGDYPRRGLRSDFDLMARPGHQRPGDRSRRDDDRQLMLEAVLSARRVLYVSWAGRSARDNSEQPPSVLVSQLRDYLAAGWGAGVLAPRTTEHPLQPFSRRYFEAPARAGAPAGGTTPPALFTHAREWRAAHVPAAMHAGSADVPVALAAMPSPEVGLTVAALVSFLKNPVKDYFRHRLDVVFDEQDAGADDDERFALAGLDEYALMQELVESMRRAVQAGPLPDPAALEALAVTQVDRVQRAGRLPLAGPGRRCAQVLVHSLVPMLARWRALQASLPYVAPHQAVHFVCDGLVLDDWLDGLRSPCPAGEGVDRPTEGPMIGQAAEPAVWLELVPGRLCTDASQPSARADRLIHAWVRMLAASVCGVAACGVIVGRDASVTTRPWPRERAEPALAALMRAWREGHFGRGAPLPLAPRTALALVQGVADVAAVYEGSDFARGWRGEAKEACLARVFPDYAALSADGRFATLAQDLVAPLAAWIASDVQIEPLVAAATVPEAEANHG